MLMQFEEEFSARAQIRVVGVGGAGGNAVNGMVQSGLAGVDFLAVNTDAQALQNSDASTRIQIGGKVTRGLGSGGDPRVGEKAVEEDHNLVAEALAGADMVFVTAGMGGGTGTGAAPTVARIARDLGALVVGIVTLPFGFEGRKRAAQAREGLAALRDEVDTIIVIPNDRLLKVVPPNTPLLDAFRVADEVLHQATKGISDLITVPGLVNLDFADVRSIMAGMGDAIMGTGIAQGESRALEAANAAISSPLLEDIDVRGAQGVLVNITGGSDMSLHEVSEVTGIVQEAVGADANMIFGAVIDPEATTELRVTVIATGFGDATTRMADEPTAHPRVASRAVERPIPIRATATPIESVPTPAVAAEAAASEAEESPLRVLRSLVRPQAPQNSAASAPETPAPETPAAPETTAPLRETSAAPRAMAAAAGDGAAADGDEEEATERARRGGIRRLLSREDEPSVFRPSADEGPAPTSGQGGQTESGAGRRLPNRDDIDEPAFLRRLRD